MKHLIIIDDDKTRLDVLTYYKGLGFSQTNDINSIRLDKGPYMYIVSTSRANINYFRGPLFDRITLFDYDPQYYYETLLNPRTGTIDYVG